MADNRTAPVTRPNLLPLTKPLWIFCWRTTLGRVKPGARSTRFNGGAIPYKPERAGPEGTLWLAARATSPAANHQRRVGGQGIFGQIGMLTRGEVTRGSVIPATAAEQLTAITATADRAVLDGELDWWTKCKVGLVGATLDGIVIDDHDFAIRLLVQARLDIAYILIGDMPVPYRESYVPIGFNVFVTVRNGMPINALAMNATLGSLAR